MLKSAQKNWKRKTQPKCLASNEGRRLEKANYMIYGHELYVTETEIEKVDADHVMVKGYDRYPYLNLQSEEKHISRFVFKENIGRIIKVANGSPAILNGEICAGPCAPASDISVWVRGDKTESCREAKSLFDEYFRKAQKYIMESITADAVRLNRAWANVYDM